MVLLAVAAMLVAATAAAAPGTGVACAIVALATGAAAPQHAAREQRASSAAQSIHDRQVCAALVATVLLIEAMLFMALDGAARWYTRLHGVLVESCCTRAVHVAVLVWRYCAADVLCTCFACVVVLQTCSHVLFLCVFAVYVLARAIFACSFAILLLYLCVEMLVDAMLVCRNACPCCVCVVLLSMCVHMLCLCCCAANVLARAVLV